MDGFQHGCQVRMDKPRVRVIVRERKIRRHNIGRGIDLYIVYDLYVVVLHKSNMNEEHETKDK